MRKIVGAWVFVVAAGLAIGALGALGNQIYMGGPGGAAWRTMSGDATITNAGVITIGAGVVTNSKLANASTTVNGQTCTLGSSCMVTAAATSLTVGTTTITSGTNGRVEYNNSGVLGELATLGSGSVFLTSDANVAFLDVTQSFTKPQRVKGGTVTPSGSTYTLDLSAQQDFEMTLGNGANTLANPTNISAAASDHQHGFLILTQPSSGAAGTVTWNSQWVAASGVAGISLSSANSAEDILAYDVIDSTHILVAPVALSVSH